MRQDALDASSHLNGSEIFRSPHCDLSRQMKRTLPQAPNTNPTSATQQGLPSSVFATFAHMPRVGAKQTAGRGKAAVGEVGSNTRAERLIATLKLLPLDDVTVEEVQAMQRGEMDSNSPLSAAAKIVFDAAEEILEPILRESSILAHSEVGEAESEAVLTTVAAADIDLKKVTALLLQLALRSGSLGFTAGTAYFALISLPGSAIYSMINTSATSAVFQLLKSWIVTQAAGTRCFSVD